MQDNASLSKPLRDAKGRLLPGNSGNPRGKLKDTPAKKIEKKAVKELVAAYQQSLAEALSKVSPVLVAKALKGDVAAIRELNDRAMGKPPQQTDITTKGRAIGSLLDEADGE